LHSTGTAFTGRIRRSVRPLQSDRRCPGTVRVSFFRSGPFGGGADNTDAIADRQSILSQYRAAAELHAKHAFIERHNTYDAKQRF